VAGSLQSIPPNRLCRFRARTPNPKPLLPQGHLHPVIWQPILNNFSAANGSRFALHRSKSTPQNGDRSQNRVHHNPVAKFKDMQGRSIGREQPPAKGREGVLEPQFCKEMSFSVGKNVTALSVLTLADLHRVRSGRSRHRFFAESNFSFLTPLTSDP